MGILTVCEHTFVSVVCVMLPRFELLVATGAASADVQDVEIARAGSSAAARSAREAVLNEPLALAPLPGARPVVGQVSPAAEAFAVTPGTPVGEAFARCPQLRLVRPDPAQAAAVHEQLLQSFEALGAEVESDPARPGTLFFESAGLEPLHHGIGGVVSAVRAAVNRPVRIGVGQTRFVARAAARTARPRRPRVIGNDCERRDFLAEAPITWLAMHSEQCAELAGRLAELGIETLGELALLRRAELAERFGRVGLVARDLVHGVEPPLRPRRPVEPLHERIELIDDAAPQVQGVALAADLEHAAQLITERLLARPERKGRTLRGVTLVARLAGGGSWSARLTLREPSADLQQISDLAARELARLPAPVAALELAADDFGPPGHEATTLFGGRSSEQRTARLKNAAEQARRAAGAADKLGRVVQLEGASRVPERRTALAAAAADAASGAPRPLQRPHPVAVEADERGRPMRVAGRLVEQECERWVVEDAWWTPRPLRRRYFELLLEGGVDVVVFRDVARGRWYRQAA